MSTFTLIPRDLLQDIEAVLQRHDGQTLSVYAEAEKIRQRWGHLNIALEDILNRLVENSGRYNIAVSFDPEEAKAALLGTATPEGTADQDNESPQPKAALQ